MPRKTTKVVKTAKATKTVEKEPKETFKCPIEDKCRVCGKDLLLRQERCVCAWCRDFDEKAQGLE